MISLAKEIINGRRLQRGEDMSFFFECELDPLCDGADMIRKELCGNKVDLCSIINGKSGRCRENCRFCAQSAHHCTNIEEYDFLDKERILKECLHNEKRGVHRFSIVTAGRTLSDTDYKNAVSAYRYMHENSNIKLCASHGLLSEEQFEGLKASGVTTYHCNIETSKRNFPNICTTHTYDDKIACIRRAQKAGLRVCSGGIIGMGETAEDRLDMAVSLSELGVRSIPINSLMPIKGTPFEDLDHISEDEILRTVAMFRYLNPTAYIRLAAGRDLMKNAGERTFRSGANATITGDMLTTSGNDIQADINMLSNMGLDIGRNDEDE